YCFRIIIHDGTGATTLTCFSPEAHTFVPDCNEVVNAIENKDTRHIPVALKQFENATYIFQYHFGKGARAGNPDFTLDAAFKPSSQPLLGLPAPESATSPPQEIMEETSSAITPTASEIEPCPSTKYLSECLQTCFEATKKTSRREFFPDTEAAEKKSRQET
ncbi:hypothetical protein Tco_0296572, partial [Tanacetum coccineum]